MSESTLNNANLALVNENKKLLDEIAELNRELKKCQRELRVSNGFLDKVTKSSDAKDALNTALSNANIKQRAYTDMLLHSCPNIIVLFDDTGRFVLSTDALMTEMDIPNFDYIKNRSYNDVLPPYLTDEGMKAFSAAFGKALSTSEVIGFDALVDFTRSGIPRFYSFEISTAGLGKSNNTMTGVLVVMIDLTDLMHEKQRAEEANKAKSDFLANMSHEIRTPMNAIMGLSEMLARSDMTAMQKKYVSDIRKASSALLVIVNDILDFSKIEAGKMELYNSNYNLKQLLDNLRSMFTVFCRDKQLYMDVIISDNLPEMAYGDETRLRQIITNLLSNAVKYTKSGGITFNAWHEDCFLRFDITDTGVGIRDEDRSKLFEPFEQLDVRKNRNVIGTGLGLTITYSLCKLMGGTLWFESIYGEGSTFSVSIPYEKENEKIVEYKSETIEFIAPEAKVLIVDDIEINLAVAEALLSINKITPDLALSGKEAIELARRNQYDAIFMDHMMPEMDGIETTKHIRGLNGWNEAVPIIALTANAIAGVEQFFLENRMDDFLPKPVDTASLNRCLKKWLPSDIVIETPG